MENTKLSGIENIVYDAVRLLESMGEYYGAERAMEMWHAMGRELGEEVKAQAFMYMLTGHGGTRVRIQAGTCTQAVPVIKAIRNATGYGLKEASDAWDLSKAKEISIECNNRELARELRRDLHEFGMVVR